MTFCPPVFFSVSDVLSFLLDKNNFYHTVKMLRGPVRDAGVISSVPWSNECISGRRCTGDEVRFNETKAAKDAAVAGKRGNNFKSARIEWELRHRPLKRGKWAQSDISKRRKSLREARILNRRGLGEATSRILTGSAASEKEHSTRVYRVDIYRSASIELVWLLNMVRLVKLITDVKNKIIKWTSAWILKRGAPCKQWV